MPFFRGLGSKKLDGIHISFLKETAMKFFEWLQRLFTGKKKMPAEPPDMQADKAALMEKILTMLSETQEEELTCDEVFAALDQAAELAARGEDVGKLMPLIQRHLEMCPDCREEFNVLKNILINAA